MALTLTSDVDPAATAFSSFELGDIATSLKAMLLASQAGVLTTGLGVSLPTADDFIYRDSKGRALLRVKNESVHLLPYVAALGLPTDNTFLQSFLQLDVDASGNPVLIRDNFEGRLKSQTLLRWSTSAGAYLFRRPKANFSALAMALESHYTSTLDRTRKIGDETNGGIATGDPSRSIDVINLTSGLHAFVGDNVITTAYGVPVTTDRVYDGELRVFVNRFF